MDYKAQSPSVHVEEISYLNSPFHQGYKLQMDIYVYILREMGFKTSDRVFFLVCNGEKSYDKFDKKLNFTTTLVPYITNTSNIKSVIKEMKTVLDSDNVPILNKSCEKCMYLAAGKTLI